MNTLHPMDRVACWAMVLTLLSLLTGPIREARASGPDAAGREVVTLLDRAMTTRDTQQRDRLWQALRRMRDPAAAPIYRKAAQSNDPFRRAHGLMGLVEIGVASELDLDTVASLDDRIAQTELVRASVEEELIDIAKAARWVDSDRLTTGARLELTRYLLQNGRSVDTALLRSATQSENHNHRAFANALLAQMGDSDAMVRLTELAESEEGANQARSIEVLNLAARSRFAALGPWALRLSQSDNPQIDRRVKLLALETALRLEAPGGTTAFIRTLRTADNEADRIRLGMVALFSASWVDASVFDPFLDFNEPVLQNIGRAGHAVVSQRNVTEAVVRLIEYNHVMLSRWALSYATEHAAAEDAQTILLALILAFDDEAMRSHGGALLLDLATEATRVLFDRDPQYAIPVLRSIVSDRNREELLTRRIMLGLLHCEDPLAAQVIAGLETFGDRHTRAVMLMLKVRGDEPLTEDDRHRLSLVIQGGAQMPDDLRLQAGWRYARKIGSLDAVLEQAAR